MGKTKSDEKSRVERQSKKKHKKEKKKKQDRSHKKKKSKDKSRSPDAFGPLPSSGTSGSEICGPLPPEDLSKAKSFAPMRKEDWEKQQSVVRRVYDEETGRSRLVKGDGEILEEIVSRDRHKEINRKATIGDGQYFQSVITQNVKK